MKILFEQKKPGRTRQTIVPVEMEIAGKPTNVGELIEAAVQRVVSDFNDRASRAEADTEKDAGGKVLTTTDIADLAETGRIAFGIVYNGKQVDADEAVANALLGYDDGLFRIFLNGRLLGEADEAIELCEGDLLTVVRLTFLAGRMW